MAIEIEMRFEYHEVKKLELLENLQHLIKQRSKIIKMSNNARTKCHTF